MIDDTQRTVVLPGTTKDELKKLPEFHLRAIVRGRDGVQRSKTTGCRGDGGTPLMPLGQQAGDGDTGLSVLLVEDEFMIALLLEEMLRDLGYRVLGPVARLGKALEMARREGVDAAILDINLNGEEVYPVAETLAARGIPFVFVTGYGRDRLRAPYRNSPTLPKPFRRGDLQDALAMARSRQQNLPT